MCLNDRMHLRKINVGCFGGGTGLPSLLGGLIGIEDHAHGNTGSGALAQGV